MRFPARFAWLLLILMADLPALAQTPVPPQRPFSQLVELWTRQLDRISYRIEQADLQAVELDNLRELTTDVRAAAAAAAQLGRNDLADTKRLLAPLEPKTGPDQPPDSDAVKAERQRLTDQAAESESRVKQCEVIVVRADQLLDRLGKLRNQIVLETLLHRGPSPLSPEVWAKLGGEMTASMQELSSAMAKWGQEGLATLRSGHQDLTPLTYWAIGTLALWWLARTLRRRFGRGENIEPGQRDRTIAAGIDGVSVVLVPILAVLLIEKVLAASQPTTPIDALLPQFTGRLISLLLVFGITATALAPHRAPWRVLPFTDSAAQHLSTALRRLIAIGLTVDFIYVLLTQGREHEAVSAVGSLILATTVALLTLPALANRAWEAARPEGSDLPQLVGGTWWSLARLILSGIVLSSIVFAVLGYTTLGSHIHSACASTCMLLALALLAHRLVADLLDAAAAPDTRTGAWVRRHLGLPGDAHLRGQLIALLVFDFVLVVLLAVAVPAAWGIDMDAILGGLGRLLHGVRIGGVNISLLDIALAFAVFIGILVVARVVRSVVRERVMPTLDAPLALRQSIDAGLNYAGVIIAILVGIAALGIDFTNLAIVLGALSVGIGLGLQNIANNVISGLIMLLERPVKAGDWVSVSGHEGFVRRINIRATEIETFQRTHVIVPNSLFLQNPVINRTYADTSSRVDILVTVGLGADVTKLEAILREAALSHDRVLRVPTPIVRFVRVAQNALEFELFVFVARVEDRLVVANDLNGTILARLIAEKIIDPRATPEYRLHDLDKVIDALRDRTKGASDAAAPSSR
jgi:potassium-dependent mechanosensitive channel